MRMSSSVPGRPEMPANASMSVPDVFTNGLPVSLRTSPHRLDGTQVVHGRGGRVAGVVLVGQVDDAVSIRSPGPEGVEVVQVTAAGHPISL